MKLIIPSVEFFGAVPTDYDAALKFIEMSGRTCYKSEDKITEGSAEKFVRKLINAGHLAMVEHSNFVVKYQGADPTDAYEILGSLGKYLNSFYNEVNRTLYIGGSLTAWYQQSCDRPLFTSFIISYGELFGIPIPEDITTYWLVCPHNEIPAALHRYAAKFICDRGVSHELVRHRPCSFAQESTRYVNYGGKDVEFIEPAGFEDWEWFARAVFERSCTEAEEHYGELIEEGLKPQQARAVLPNALKTEIVVTAEAAEWSHIRTLRTSAAAQPDMQRVMNMMPWEEFL